MITKETIFQYLDALANGVDPKTGEVLEDDTVLNRPDIIRVLFGAKEFLGKTKDKKTIDNTHPFKIVDKDVLIDSNATMTNFVTSINDKNIMHNTKKLRYKIVIEWLLKEGYLTVDESDKKIPTEKGEGIGISLEYRERNFHSYTVLTYSIEAQRFILENIINGNIK